MPCWNHRDLHAFLHVLLHPDLTVKISIASSAWVSCSTTSRNTVTHSQECRLLPDLHLKDGARYVRNEANCAATTAKALVKQYNLKQSSTAPRNAKQTTQRPTKKYAVHARMSTDSFALPPYCRRFSSHFVRTPTTGLSLMSRTRATNAQSL